MQRKGRWLESCCFCSCFSRTEQKLAVNRELKRDSRVAGRKQSAKKRDKELDD
jgi:hypothetical protein